MHALARDRRFENKVLCRSRGHTVRISPFCGTIAILSSERRLGQRRVEHQLVAYKDRKLAFVANAEFEPVDKNPCRHLGARLPVSQPYSAHQFLRMRSRISIASVVSGSLGLCCHVVPQSALSVLTQVGQWVGRDAIADRCEKTCNSIGVVVIPLSSSEPVSLSSQNSETPPTSSGGRARSPAMQLPCWA